MSIASCPFSCLTIHRLCISSENQQVIYTYVSGLKEKTIILVSIINYQFAVNTKSQKRNTKIKTVLKGRKTLKSHTFKEYFPQHII